MSSVGASGSAKWQHSLKIRSIKYRSEERCCWWWQTNYPSGSGATEDTLESWRPLERLPNCPLKR